MGFETQESRAKNFLIGFTAQHGQAWWRDAESDAFAQNHYDGPVPYEAVETLFDWEPERVPLYVPRFARVESDSDDPFTEEDYAELESYVAIRRSDTGDLLGVHGSGYPTHGYRERLLHTLDNILDGAVSIGSAGLISNGKVAWVQVELPDNVQVPGTNEPFRPWLAATSSMDGTIANVFKKGVTRIICENTRTAFFGSSADKALKIKNTKLSSFRLKDARQALGILETIATEYIEDTTLMLDTTVTSAQEDKIIELLVPMPDDHGSKKARTMAENKRISLGTLLYSDDRVAPWRGTAWGILQAFNTWNQHERIVQSAERWERNRLNDLKGKTADDDTEVVETINKVLAMA